MSTTMTAGAPGSPVSSNEGWGYVSGRLSVLETLLLPRNFFEGMLKSRSLSDARSALGKTSYRTAFSGDEQVRGYDTTLDTAADSLRKELLAVSPPHVLTSYFEVPGRYLVFRHLFLRAAARGASVSDLETVFDTLAVNPFERSSLDSHIAALHGREAPQSADSVARSLFLDSAVSTLRLALARSAPEEKVRDLLGDMAVLQCWSAVLRSRWNGTSAEVIRRWFIVPESIAEMVRATATLSDSNLTGGLAGAISEGALRVLRDIGTDQIKRNIDAAAGEAIRSRVLECRMVTYGPERLAAFFVAWMTELENLRLTLASIVSGVEPPIVLERLRREYV
jgi:vacuolar-type H+-ATPase subunit C/Vma6